MTIVEFDLRGYRKEGGLVKENERTVIVKVRHAGKTFNVKRHKDKHHVVFVEKKEQS